MASLNITSLLKHIDELRVFLNDQNIDVLAINETRLNESISDQDVTGQQMAGLVVAYVFIFVQA